MTALVEYPVKHAAGGRLFDTHGARFGNGMTFVNEGGTHEQNPNGGVQVGVDGDGTPNLVEQGEVIVDVGGGPYVMSKRGYPGRDELLMGGLPLKYAGKSYAEIAESLQKESEERPLDEVSLRGLRAMLERLAALQETWRGEIGAEGTQNLNLGQDLYGAREYASETAPGQAPEDAGGMTEAVSACGGRIYNGTSDMPEQGYNSSAVYNSRYKTRGYRNGSYNSVSQGGAGNGGYDYPAVDNSAHKVRGGRNGSYNQVRQTGAGGGGGYNAPAINNNTYKTRGYRNGSYNTVNQSGGGGYNAPAVDNGSYKTRGSRNGSYNIVNQRACGGRMYAGPYDIQYQIPQLPVIDYSQLPPDDVALPQDNFSLGYNGQYMWNGVSQNPTVQIGGGGGPRYIEAPAEQYYDAPAVDNTAYKVRGRRNGSYNTVNQGQNYIQNYNGRNNGIKLKKVTINVGPTSNGQDVSQIINDAVNQGQNPTEKTRELLDAGLISRDQYDAVMDQLLSAQSELAGVRGDYGVLQGQYDDLNTDYTNALVDYNNLNDIYDELQGQYGDLQGQYNGLQDRYGAMNRGYNDLLWEYNNANAMRDTDDYLASEDESFDDYLRGQMASEQDALNWMLEDDRDLGVGPMNYARAQRIADRRGARRDQYAGNGRGGDFLDRFDARTEQRVGRANNQAHNDVVYRNMFRDMDRSDQQAVINDLRDQLAAARRAKKKRR